MSTPVLTYFNGRGRAEIVRITLAAIGQKFDEVLLKEPEEFDKLKTDGKLLFGQAPLLEIDGKRLVQTNAILRYLATKGNLWGTPDQKLQVDIVFEGARDFMAPFRSIGFAGEEETLNKLKSTLTKYLPVFEKILKENGGSFLVGKQLTLADLSLLEPLLVTVECFGEEALKDYPCVKAFYINITTQERVAAFVSGPQRKAKPSPVYVKEVIRILRVT